MRGSAQDLDAITDVLQSTALIETIDSSPAAIKIANVLDAVPSSLQPKVKTALHSLMNAENKEAADVAIDELQATYGAKYAKSVDKVLKDRDVLLTHFDFRADHWIHLRTTNVIESTFATVRLRTQRTKGCGSRLATLTMVYKLGLEAQKSWRRLNGAEQLAQVIAGTRFVDGVEAAQTPQAA